MADMTSEINKDIEYIFRAVVTGIGLGITCFFSGFYELRKKIPLIIYTAAAAVPLILFAIKQATGVGESKYILIAVLLPVGVLLVLGAISKQKQLYYQKLFSDAGFKGKDGKTPCCISTKEKDHKTTSYFKSNIPLTIWKKNTALLQTTLDCNILLLEQGNSNRIVKLVSVPSDYDIGNMLTWNEAYISPKKSEIVLGASIYTQIKFDFNNTPHWIFAGSTGSGKSVLLRLVVYQCIKKKHRVIVMDFKRGVEFGRMYDDFCEVVMEKKRAVAVLQSLVEENKRRLDIFRTKGLKDMEDYNKKHPQDQMERVVLFIDELAILLIPTRDKEDQGYTNEASGYLENLAILGRAAGINMVFGIQRPDANTVTGQIKSNVSGRVCGYFSDAAPSLIVLNNTKANELPAETKGRFMYQDSRETVEFQGYYLDDKAELQKLIDEKKKPKEYRDPWEPEPAAPPLRKVQSRKAEVDTNYDDC